MADSRPRRIWKGEITWAALALAAVVVALSSGLISLLVPPLQLAPPAPHIPPKKFTWPNDLLAQGQLLPVAFSLGFGAAVRALAVPHNTAVAERVGIGIVGLGVAIAALVWFVLNAALLAAGRGIALPDSVVLWSLVLCVAALGSGFSAVWLYEWDLPP